VYIESTDVKDDSSDNSSTVLGETDGNFKYVFKVENLKMVDGKYHVSLAKGIARFENADKNIVYFVSPESTLSTF
jgi:hypothetical protein